MDYQIKYNFNKDKTVESYQFAGVATCLATLVIVKYI